VQIKRERNSPLHFREQKNIMPPMVPVVSMNGVAYVGDKIVDDVKDDECDRKQNLPIKT
jgi:hypothetical protein